MMFVYGYGVLDFWFLGLSYRLFNVSLRSKPVFQDTPLFVPHSERTVILSLSQFSYRPFFASLRSLVQTPLFHPPIEKRIKYGAQTSFFGLDPALFFTLFSMGRFSRHRNGTYIFIPGN